MDGAMEHAGLVLELLPKPKMKTNDEEATGDPKPGEPAFVQFMEKKMVDFYTKRGSVLRTWAKEKGLSEDQFDAAKPVSPDAADFTPDEAKHRKYHILAQCLMILHKLSQ